jgi:F0F1-type ATP synthase membrane subunit a
MAVAVLAHLVISMVHGTAHNGAHIPMSLAATLFVFVVILAGPVVGLALSWRAAWTGTLIVALTMAGSLVFGCVNHFLLDSPDHVSHVAAQWRTIFATTAVLLTITEMLGLGVTIRLIQLRRSC